MATGREKPAAMIIMPELDMELVHMLAKHYLVIVSKEKKGVILRIYKDD